MAKLNEQNKLAAAQANSSNIIISNNEETKNKSSEPKKIVGNVEAEQAKNIFVLKEKKSKSFAWGKLALFLVIVGSGGIIGLIIAGLFLSLWTIIPASVLLIGIGIGIKVIYDEYQRKKNDQQIKLLTPDGERGKFTIQGRKLLPQYQVKNSRTLPQLVIQAPFEPTSQEKRTKLDEKNKPSKNTQKDFCFN